LYNIVTTKDVISI